MNSHCRRRRSSSIRCWSGFQVDAGTNSVAWRSAAFDSESSPCFKYRGIRRLQNALSSTRRGRIPEQTEAGYDTALFRPAQRNTSAPSLWHESSVVRIDIEYFTKYRTSLGGSSLPWDATWLEQSTKKTIGSADLTHVS